MGTFITPLTSGGTFPLDQALTNFAKKFRNNALVADLIAPRVPTDLRGGRYIIWGREDQNVLQQTLRADGSPAQRIRQSTSTDTFFCDSHALTSAIPDETQSVWGRTLGDLRLAATRSIVSKIQLDREVALATMLTDTAQVTNNTTLAGTSQWSDYGNSDPEGDIETALSKIRESGIQASFLLLGEQVYKKLKNHPAVKGRYAAIRPGSIGPDQIAEVFGVPLCLVARAVQLDKGGTVSFPWGKNALIGFADPSAGNEDLSGAKTFVWTGGPMTQSQQDGGQGFGVFPWREPQADAKSDNVTGDFYYHQKITAVEALFLVKNAVA